MTDKNEKVTDDSNEINVPPLTTGKKSEKKAKKHGFLGTLFIFLLAFSVMLGVMGGFIYYILHNNINKIAERNRSTLIQLPLIKYALPEPKGEFGADNPDDYSDKELRVKYVEILKSRNELRNMVDELNKNVLENSNKTKEVTDMKMQTESTKSQVESTKTDLEKEKIKIVEDKKKFDEYVVAKDKEAFKQFYETANKDIAKKVYEDIIKMQVGDEGKKQVAKIYETMEPSKASKILQELSQTNNDLVISILKSIKKEIASEIIAAMDTKIAASLSQKIEESYKLK